MKIALGTFCFVVFFELIVCSTQFAQKLCRSTEDCDWDQCCIEAQTRLPGFDGICKNPSTKGGSCDPENGKTPDGRYKKTCPCEEGLNCKTISSLDEKPIYKCY